MKWSPTWFYSYKQITNTLLECSLFLMLLLLLFFSSAYVYFIMFDVDGYCSYTLFPVTKCVLYMC